MTKQRRRFHKLGHTLELAAAKPRKAKASKRELWADIQQRMLQYRRQPCYEV